MTALLQLHEVAKSFGGVRVLNEVSLEVQPGVVFGLAGPNGAGKTTLINVISGLAAVDAGRVHFDGADRTTARTHELSRLGVARTFQAIRLAPSLTVLENVMVAVDHAGPSVMPRLQRLLRGGTDERRTREVASEMLNQLGVAQFADVYPATLPYGIQRRVEIARALATRPRLLLLDEPAAGMSASEADAVGTLLRRLVDGGLTIFVIEHNLGFLRGISDRLAVLNFGVKIAEGSWEDVFTSDEVRIAYLGSEAA